MITKSLRIRPIFFGFAAAALFAASVAQFFPVLQAKEEALLLDRNVGIALHAFDVVEAARAENAALSDVADALRTAGATHALGTNDLRPEEEAVLRSAGFLFIWAQGATARIRTNDGVALGHERGVEFPRNARTVLGLLRDAGGIFPIFESSSFRGIRELAARVPGRWVKTHAVSLDDRFDMTEGALQSRIARAANERWNRLFVLPFLPLSPLTENVAFVQDVAGRLSADGFYLRPPNAFTVWPIEGNSFLRRAMGSSWDRSVAVAILFFIVPLISVAAFVRPRTLSPAFALSATTAFSCLAGVLIHAIASHPENVVGVQTLRFGNIQLLFPVVAAWLALFRWKDFKSYLREPLTGRDLIFFAGLVLGILGFLLAPKTPAPIDGVPAAIWFAVGHPLLLLGLISLRNRRRTGEGALDGRLLIILGFLGQGFLLNAFSQGAAPLQLILERTFHGWWTGTAVGMGFIFFVRKLGSGDRAAGRPRPAHAERATVRMESH